MPENHKNKSLIKPIALYPNRHGRRRWIIISLVVITLTLIGFMRIYRRYDAILVTSDATYPTPTDPYADYTVAILGFGGPQHEGGYLTDTIIISRISPRNKMISLIAIPRDVWIQFPLFDPPLFYKINAAYTLGRDQLHYPNKPKRYQGKAGGGNLAKDTLAEIVGFPIDYFAAISFNGFTKSIDTLSGIDVSVPESFDDEFYPIESEKNNLCGKSDDEVASLSATLSATLLEEAFPCRFEHIHFDRGITHMDGETALKFVRSRKSKTSGGDHNRNLRQEAVLKALREKIVSINFIPKAIPFITTLTNDMQTDLSIDTIRKKLEISADIDRYTIQTIDISDTSLFMESRSDDGQYIFIPTAGIGNWNKIHDSIGSQLNQSEN